MNLLTLILCSVSNTGNTHFSPSGLIYKGFPGVNYPGTYLVQNLAE